ncbi:MAG TPA: circularly permuted type 2 ATP-grasp protein [Candidatus Sulfotelmatobacter sp.]|nr:circularly permuted type 2 ATP-grasp protein [Candidatus Sulfotelmatobacter sp.]
MQETSTEPQKDPALLEKYRANKSAFDELMSAEGRIRPHYAKFFQTLEHLGQAELKRRRETCAQLIHEQGIYYNVYGDPRGMERPWQMDPIPLVLEPDEWRALEAGLIQRATLLNTILADCYTQQELIRSRWLAPAMVFAQPDFLRPCHGVRAPKEIYLHFYAADLARSPDGRWWVLSDRTQIPTGAGYALANRLVTSRIFPEPFRENNVQRIAGFFRDVQDSLEYIAPHRHSSRVVMLTPGPHNETYFEQAYLARYLGYMLVEGQDLTVRDDIVYLKTLNGLERVDVILRRVDDNFCDPLELRNDSMLGVPGLIEAIRAGNAAVANAPGSGLVQSPAFMPFLPGLCGHILGEELKLPSVATWWCGQESARKYVLEHLETLAVIPAFAAGGQVNLSPDELKRRIEFDPDLFVAQERVDLSTAPSLDGALVPCPFALRVFLVAKAGGGYSVMPGGLVRVSPDPGGQFISMQHGGGSKDAWVISDFPVEETTLLHKAGVTFELRRTGNNLPSRLADNFFWLGRYSERADATARLLRTALRRFNPERTSGALPALGPLLQTLERQGQLPAILEDAELRQNPEAFEAELLAAIFDPERAGSLCGIVGNLFRLAAQVRDRTSNDLWRVISKLNDRLAPSVPVRARPSASAPPEAPQKDSPVMLAGDAVRVLDDILDGVAAFHGLARENMTRAQAWRFVDMGLRIERAVYLCTLLDAVLAAPDAENHSLLEAVLEVADSSITYRSRYNLLPQLAAVADMILLDDRNPRAVLFQINQLVQHFERLPQERDSAGREILNNCRARLERGDTRELAGYKENLPGSKTGRLIQQTLRDLPNLSDAIAASYFAHSAISRTGREFVT